MVNAGTWTLKKSRFTGFLKLVIENAKSTNYRVCKICRQPFSKNSKLSIEKHAKTHPELSITDYENFLIEIATKLVVTDARSFRTIDTLAFHNYTKAVASVA